MASSLSTYLNSSRFNRKFLYTLAIDILFILLIYVLTSGFGMLINQQALALTGGKSPELIKQEMYSYDPFKLQQFLGDLKSFLGLFIAATLLLAATFTMLFSASRLLIWHILKDAPYKLFWRWNLLTITLFLASCMYGLLALGITLLISLLLAFLVSSNTFILYASKLVAYLFLILYLIIVFLLHYSFTQKQKVFEAFAEAAHLLNRKMLLAGMFILASALMIGIILYLSAFLLYFPLLNAFISIAFLGWMRFYLLKVVHQI